MTQKENVSINKEEFWYQVGFRTTLLTLLLLLLAATPAFLALSVGTGCYTEQLNALTATDAYKILPVELRFDLVLWLALPWLIMDAVGLLFFAVVAMSLNEKKIRAFAIKLYVRQKIERQKRKQKFADDSIKEAEEWKTYLENKGFTYT